MTFIAANGDDQEAIEIRYEDENIWLTQKMMAALYDVSVSAINQHLKKIFDDNELDENSVIKKYLITANDGKSYNTKHYNLQAIIAVGFKVYCEPKRGENMFEFYKTLLICSTIIFSILIIFGLN